MCAEKLLNKYLCGLYHAAKEREDQESVGTREFWKKEIFKMVYGVIDENGLWELEDSICKKKIYY